MSLIVEETLVLLGIGKGRRVETSDAVAELVISLVDVGKDTTSAVVDLLDEVLNTGDWADAD